MKTVIHFKDGRREEFPELFPNFQLEGENTVCLINNDNGIESEDVAFVNIKRIEVEFES